jgi:hypothetical protein
MVNQIKIFFVPILLLVAACAPASPTAEATRTIAPKPTSTLAQESVCQQISLEPTPDAKISSLFPPVSEEDNVMGPKDAPMTIIEYGDFQ